MGREKWTRRAERYRDWKDTFRQTWSICAPRLDPSILTAGSIGLRFFIAMPASWSLKKRGAFLDTPHRSRPDTDNLTKSVLDAMLEQDSGAWDLRPQKYWGLHGAIELWRIPAWELRT